MNIISNLSFWSRYVMMHVWDIDYINVVNILFTVVCLYSVKDSRYKHISCGKRLVPSQSEQTFFGLAGKNWFTFTILKLHWNVKLYNWKHRYQKQTSDHSLCNISYWFSQTFYPFSVMAMMEQAKGDCLMSEMLLIDRLVLSWFH